ncbi:MAG TPA: FkbM family methyltransferase [Solirubrobacteraceae bacterium]|nr:FkbM family methyltransferase [Solirubrobacteraceae bacterium]
MAELRRRAQTRLTRAATGLLRALGVRERFVRWRLARARARRAAAEARGEDRLSHPALHELDFKLNAIIDRDGGFYVEAGGHDGFTQSNTYWLERFRGWRGVLVEPMPELAAEARLSRPAATVFQCALVAADEPRATLRMRFGDLMSMVDGARESHWPALGTVLGWRDPYELDVPARTLSSLLDEIGAPEVDLLSLDVEGFEGPALRGLDLARHAPRYVLVELHDRAHDKPPVDAVLGGCYVEHGWLSPVDLLYVRRDVMRRDVPQAEGDEAPAGSDASSDAAT